MFDAHERTIPGSKQKLRINQRSKERCTRRLVEIPETTRLRFGQTQSRHLEKLSLNAPEHIISRTQWLWRHTVASESLGGQELPCCS
jgi:hypothetical protein